MSTGTSLSLAGSTVLLCGASGGIGTAVAAELATRGAVTTVVGRDSGRLESVAAPGGTVVGDLRDPAVCEAAIDAARAATGGIDVLINAVGVAAFGAITDLAPQEMRDLLETNVLVPMLLARAALPHIRRGGVIANLSGIIAEPGKAMAGMAAYVASKAAVRGFDEALTREARRAGIRVLDIRPPHTETGLAQRPIAGQAPGLPEGLPPADVARVICDALADGARDLPSEAFAR